MKQRIMHVCAGVVGAVTIAIIAAAAPVEAQERPLQVQRPALPALPTLTGREARGVAHLERVARRTLGCVYYEGERGGEEYSDERCWDWYDRLGNARSAGVHASGRVLLERLESAEELEDNHVRLIAILGQSERRVAAPYLLHLLARAQGDGDGSTWLAAETLAALRQVTRHDAAPIPPWVNRFDALREATVRAHSLDGWLVWYQGAAERTYREWRSDSLEHANAHLHDEDPAVRFAAIERLRSEHRRHHALVASIREMITQPELAPEARRYVTRYAGRHGLMTRAEIREVLAGV